MTSRVPTPTSTYVDLVWTGPPYNRIKFLELMHHSAMVHAVTVVGDTFRTLFAAPGSNFEMRITFLMGEHGDLDRL